MPGGGLRHALELLRDVLNDFPDEPVISFNLVSPCRSKPASGGHFKTSHSEVRDS
jgi:hypothetical protein